MENLALCSKVLYDKDIIEKSKELLKYKKQVDCPTRHFDSWDQYENLLNKMYTDIHDKIEEWLNDPSHYIYWDIDTINTDGVYDTLYQSLENFTKCKEWSEFYSRIIMLSIESMLNALDELFGLFKNDFINCPFSPKVLTKYVTHSIKYQLSEAGCGGYLGDDFAVITEDI